MSTSQQSKLGCVKPTAMQMVLQNTPIKRIKEIQDMGPWERSLAYYGVFEIVHGIANTIQNVRNSAEMFISPQMKKLLIILERFNELLDNTPPLVKSKSARGNLAFKTWQRKANEIGHILLIEALPDNKCCHIKELGFYLSESFGNTTSIRYGTAHELQFIFFVRALFEINVLKEHDYVAVALKLFRSYLELVRRLQVIYRMDPAGSDDVWGLDDYQFVPFVWGAAQLSIDAPFPPAKFLNPDIINEWKDEYMFMGCIDYIAKTKKGHFAEHSHSLWTITCTPTWAELGTALAEMFQFDIMNRFSIIQLMSFGVLMNITDVVYGTDIVRLHLGVPITAKVEKTLTPDSSSEMSSSESSNAEVLKEVVNEAAKAHGSEHKKRRSSPDKRADDGDKTPKSAERDKSVEAEKNAEVHRGTERDQSEVRNKSGEQNKNKKDDEVNEKTVKEKDLEA